MTYEVNYANLPEAERDEAAIQDIRSYLPREAWEQFLVMAGKVETVCTNEAVQSLNWQFGFAGITGKPFHAFCRKYCPEAYNVWINTP